jgi:hypothetical protein
MDGEEEKSTGNIVQERRGRKEERGFRLDLGGTVEIEINSRLGRLFELGPKCGRKKAYE